MTLDFSLQEIFVGSLYAALMGACFGFLYDWVRLIRLLLGTAYRGRFMKGLFAKHSAPIEEKVKAFKEKHRWYRAFLKWLDVFLDFLYCAFCGMCYAVFLYAVNCGIFRFAFILGTFLGFFLYRKTIGRVFFFLLRELAAFFYLIFHYIVVIFKKLIFRPLKWIFSRIFFPFYRKLLLLFHKKYVIMKKKKED